MASAAYTAFVASLDDARDWRDEVDYANFDAATDAEKQQLGAMLLDRLRAGVDTRMPAAVAVLLDFATAAPALQHAAQVGRGHFQSAAADALLSLTQGRLVDSLSAALHSQVADDRVHAAKALGRIPTVPAGNALAAALDDSDAEVQREAIRQLTDRYQLRSRDAFDKVVAALDDPARQASGVRALKRLATLGGPEAAEVLGETGSVTALVSP
jgi:hypothetical protein